MFPCKQSRVSKDEEVLKSESQHTDKLKKLVGGDKGILRGGMESQRGADEGNVQNTASTGQAHRASTYSATQ